MSPFFVVIDEIVYDLEQSLWKLSKVKEAAQKPKQLPTNSTKRELSCTIVKDDEDGSESDSGSDSFGSYTID